jgi:putative transposase
MSDEPIQEFAEQDFQQESLAHMQTGSLSAEAQIKLKIIQQLMEPCNRATYSERLREATLQLGKSVRTVQRLVKAWERDGLAALTEKGRSDKGEHRIDSQWKDFITKTYREGNKGSMRLTPAQVAVRVKVRAQQLGLDNFPSHMTVYRVLQPLLEKKKQGKSMRNVGWRGARLALKTRSGNELAVEYSNQVWQCDHTRADVLLVDQYGELLGRPWLTTVIDTYSRCIMGIHLGFDAPSSQVVALALRHAMLPKDYGPEYELACKWGTYGRPQHLLTDGGRDFRAEHIQQIGVQLGFVCHLRDRPEAGGVVERPFGTLNTEFFSTMPGYTGSNTQQRPEDAEKSACFTLRELERLLVRYLVDNYNQRIDARMGDQTRFQRWEAGLISSYDAPTARELDICLMKRTRRTVYREGYLRFENITYRGENLAGYAGEMVVVRFSPRDITTVYVYRHEEGKEAFLANAHAHDLEMEQISLEEAKASSRRVREAGKTLSNRSILEEVRDRDLFTRNKKTRKERRKIEQELVKESQRQKEQVSEIESDSVVTKELQSPEMPEVLDYEKLREDYEW